MVPSYISASLLIVQREGCSFSSISISIAGINPSAGLFVSPGFESSYLCFTSAMFLANEYVFVVVSRSVMSSKRDEKYF